MAGDATQNYTLSDNQIAAARLTAEDELSDEEIATQCGITRKSLWSWRQRPEFQALVSEHREAFLNRSLEEGFADKRKRLKVLNALSTGVLAELAAPGGFSREEVKIAANGEHISYQVHDKAKFDTIRGLLDDIAKEMGDRKTVAEVSGPDGEPLVLGLVGVDLGKV